MAKVFCCGSEGYINQIDRIKEGFILNGWEISSIDNADLIYCNDPATYDLAINSSNNKAKIIFNVLDIPFHLLISDEYDTSKYPKIQLPTFWKKSFDPKKLKEKLVKADLVTCICGEVKWQLKNWCDVDSKVIFNPVKDVKFLNLDNQVKAVNRNNKKYKYLYVGRANDPNKRFSIVVDTINKLGDSSDSLAVVGSENPGFGDYYGVVSDYILNYLYNSVDYFFFPSAFKSIGLPALESVICKCKTIVCNDDPTTNEFWSEIGLPPDSSIIAEAIKSKEWNTICENFIEKKSNEYEKFFNKKTIAQNIINEFYKIKTND